MRGNLIWVVGLSGSNVEFMSDESGEWEVVGGRITQHNNFLDSDVDYGQENQDDNFWNNDRVIEFVTTMKMKNCSLSDIHEFKRRDSITNPNSKQAKQSQVESNPEYIITAFRNIHSKEIFSMTINGTYSQGIHFMDEIYFISKPHNTAFEIYSVERTSDDEAFVVDEITEQGKIGWFKIHEGEMIVECIEEEKYSVTSGAAGFIHYKLSQLTKKKEKEVLFTKKDMNDFGDYVAARIVGKTFNETAMVLEDFLR